eukprot:TRINITY_DN21511_c0_g1_i1.p1 TRINITY_DN21511_c0_g1~~TRINITY_DN21511_c0_g1_i1.p1  ORF type:complete len:419 (+),score=75.27 TRINITY_DN21511_c0_g1_i1:1-1257(+)
MKRRRRERVSNCSCLVLKSSGVPCRCTLKSTFVKSFVSDLMCGEVHRVSSALQKAIPADFTHDLLLSAVPAFVETVLKEDTPADVQSALCLWVSTAVTDHLYLLPERHRLSLVDSFRTLLHRTQAAPLKVPLLRTLSQWMSKYKGLVPFTQGDYHSIVCQLLEEDIALQKCVLEVLPSLSRTYPEFISSEVSLVLSQVFQDTQDEAILVSLMEIYTESCEHAPSEEDVPRTLQLLSHPSKSIRLLSLETLTEIVKYGYGVPFLRKHNIMPLFAPYLQSGASCVEDIISMLHNSVRMYKQDFIQLLIDESLIPILVDLLVPSREDLLTPFFAMTSAFATDNQMRFLTESGLVSPLCDILERSPHLSKFILSIFRRLLSLGRKEVFAGYAYSTYQMAMEDCDLPAILKQHNFSLPNFWMI